MKWAMGWDGSWPAAENSDLGSVIFPSGLGGWQRFIHQCVENTRKAGPTRDPAIGVLHLVTRVGPEILRQLWLSPHSSCDLVCL